VSQGAHLFTAAFSDHKVLGKEKFALIGSRCLELMRGRKGHEVYKQAEENLGQPKGNDEQQSLGQKLLEVLWPRKEN
jgi:hypothetical protein